MPPNLNLYFGSLCTVFSICAVLLLLVYTLILLYDTYDLILKTMVVVSSKLSDLLRSQPVLLCTTFITAVFNLNAQTLNGCWSLSNFLFYHDFPIQYNYLLYFTAFLCKLLLLHICSNNILLQIAYGMYLH